MRETWLGSNRRAVLLGAIIPTLLVVSGMGLFIGSGANDGAPLAKNMGLGVFAIGDIWLLSVCLQLRRPRMAYDQGQLLLYVRHGEPLRVPIELVEGFLLGQGPTMLDNSQAEKWETSTLVIRLSEKAQEWGHVEVEPALAHWCDHYVTIRGTWCEPLSVALVQRLNARLYEVSKLAARGASL